ncbi:MAG: DNA repair protein RecO (recombination protein O) [Chlamydiales bacterium]|jgi:DNA repair protein RecO (recombination protein O)
MELLRDEGIIIHTLNFRDYDRIVTAFTLNSGLIKLIVKGANRPKNSLHSLTSPLTRVELIFAPAKGELHRFHEGSVLNFYLSFRKDLKLLDLACSLTQVIKNSQLLGKPSPMLYQLLARYLEYLPKIEDPSKLLSSFRMKTLRHDGLLFFRDRCNVCENVEETLFLAHGETFCQKHSPRNALEVSKSENQTLQYLAFCRSISELKSVNVSVSLEKTIEKLFDRALEK